METQTKTYSVRVMVEYIYDVEANSYDEASELGWDYENYPYSASVYSIDVDELPEEDEDNE